MKVAATIAVFTLVLTAVAPSTVSVEKPKTSHVVFVTEYIRELAALENIGESSEQELKQNPGMHTRAYNELMNCQVKDELVSQLIALNNKLNLLSPDLVHGDEERAEVQQQRENLYAEIKHHRAKGHEGKPCPAARQV